MNQTNKQMLASLDDKLTGMSEKIDSIEVTLWSIDKRLKRIEQVLGSSAGDDALVNAMLLEGVVELTDEDLEVIKSSNDKK